MKKMTRKLELQCKKDNFKESKLNHKMVELLQHTHTTTTTTKE